jgi:hypothetical protein
VEKIRVKSPFITKVGVETPISQTIYKNNFMNPLSLTNPSLEIDYYSMTLSNYDIIRLFIFISKTMVGFVE